MTDTQILTPNPLTEQALGIALFEVAEIKRTIAAPLARVWENVHDWEHLPHLHESSFSKCELQAQGPWGWRAATRGANDDPAQADNIVELVTDHQAGHYVSRIIEGPNKGGEVWTHLIDKGEATDIHVRFLVPLDPKHDTPEMRDLFGKVMVGLYTQLWDEDELMMIDRHAALQRARRTTQTIPLGTRDDVMAKLPLTIETEAGPIHVDDVDGELAAWHGVCPHMLGPLPPSCRQHNRLTCPWHSYRFMLTDGTQVGGALALALRCRISETDNQLILTITDKDSQ